MDGDRRGSLGCWAVAANLWRGNDLNRLCPTSQFVRMLGFFRRA